MNYINSNNIPVIENMNAMIEAINRNNEITKALANNYSAMLYYMASTGTYNLPMPNLDNCTASAQASLPEEGAQTMATKRMRLCVGYQPDGQPIIQQVSGNNEIELSNRIAAAMFNSERRNEFFPCVTQAPKTDTPSFKAYTEEYFALYKKDIKPTTIVGYRAILRNHLYPRWANTSIDQITHKDIQIFLDEKSHLANKYLKEIKTLLSQILESAMRDHLIPLNPAKDPRIKIHSQIRTERGYVKDEDYKDIAAHLHLLDDQARLFMALVMYTGMRRGEVLGLRWEDLNLADQTIRVERNVTYANRNQGNVGTVKTASGKRTIPIVPALLSHLVPMKDSGYVIGDCEKPISLQSYRNMWNRIKRTINVHKATPHMFRHSMATFLFDMNVNVKTIQAILGQKDLGVTLNTYTHAKDSRKQEAMQTFNQHFGSAQP